MPAPSVDSDSCSCGGSCKDASNSVIEKQGQLESIGLTVETSPIDLLLQEQATLQTPVAVFSKDVHASGEPEQARYYKQLIPLSKPQKGEQYGFKVDLDRCTGCKACVSACHSLNGLEDSEAWRDVGLIQGTTKAGAAYSQTVTTACHHCEDPGCLNGCPVMAYEKDEATGIVHHLDDQCIGCQYCVLKCPYDVPKYSKNLGIVRKCDMCHGRLAVGEAPACVQACPTEAISIQIVSVASVKEKAEKDAFLPGAPAPAYTVPTSSYVSAREVPENAVAADRAVLSPEHTHLPLVLMLVLTQAACGAFFTASFLSVGSPAAGIALITGVVALLLGLVASTTHLGRPLGAWRFFLGLKRSWLSREILAFSLFAPVGMMALGAHFFGLSESVQQSASLLASVVGAIAVFTSVMIYHDTQRPFWRLPISAFRFYGTVATFAAFGWWVSAPGELSLLVLIVIYGGKLLGEAFLFLPAFQEPYTPAWRSARLMLEPLRRVSLGRYGAGFLFLFSIQFIAAAEAFTPALIVPTFAFLACAEVLERILFFKAVAAPKMPGGITQ